MFHLTIIRYSEPFLKLNFGFNRVYTQGRKLSAVKHKCYNGLYLLSHTLISETTIRILQFD